MKLQLSTTRDNTGKQSFKLKLFGSALIALNTRGNGFLQLFCSGQAITFTVLLTASASRVFAPYPTIPLKNLWQVCYIRSTGYQCDDALVGATHRFFKVTHFTPL